MIEPERSMMYSTPTLDRRPRPPGTIPHRSIYHGNMNSPASTSNSNLNLTETPLSRQVYRKTNSKPTTAAQGGGEVVGLGLSSPFASSSTSTIIKDTTSLDIPQPSPPPPYGPTTLTSLEAASTPPTQDIDDDPLDNVHLESNHDENEDEEEEQRRERAMNLAKSLGLDFLSPSKLSTDESVEDGLDAEEIRKQLKAMKRRLKIRDHVMAAQAADYLLKQHEELVSALPTHVRGLLPHLHELTTPRQSLPTREILNQAGSTTSSPVLDRLYNANMSPSNSPIRSPRQRLFRTVRTSDISKPFPHHHAHAHAHARDIFNTPKKRPSFAETQQQESDERLILLERALAESRENEEIQRKLAARLKRDFEKLQMDFDHAEQTISLSDQTLQVKRPEARSMDSTSSMESMTSSQFDSWAWKQTLDLDDDSESRRVLRPKSTKLRLRIKPRKSENQKEERHRDRDENENDSTWGLTKFPEFPGEAESSIGDRLTRLPPRPTFNRLKAKLRQPSPKKESPRHARVSSTSDHDYDHDLPMPSPRRAETPSRSSRRHRADLSSEASRSRTPSRSRSVYHNSPSRGTQLPLDQTPLRGPYDSISSQLASVRKFVTNSVRSVGMNGARSLGSELGSEYGDTRDTDDMMEITKGKDVDMWEDENYTGSDGTEGSFSQPITIPSNASSGLSSLAMALSCSPIKKIKTPRRSPRSPTSTRTDEFDPGSYRPKKGRRNWIRPLLLSQRYDTRPAMYPRTSSISDRSLALAHRRQKSSKEELYDLVQEITKKNEGERKQLELYSPPARLVNDLIILLSVLLEWIEMIIVIVYRVSVAVKYGRESIFRTWRQGRDKRYYL